MFGLICDPNLIQNILVHRTCVTKLDLSRNFTKLETTAQQLYNRKCGKFQLFKMFYITKLVNA